MNRTLSHTAIYSIGVIVQNVTSLVMLPIYTRYLAPADYGIVELLNMILDVTMIVFGLKADQGLFRYYQTAETVVDKKAVVSTVFFLTLALNSIGALALIVLSPQLASAFLGDSDLWHYLAIYALCLLAPALIAVPYNYSRLLQRPGLFLTLSITKLGVQVGLNVLFVVVMKMKAMGVIYSTIITQIALGTLYSFVMMRSIGWIFRKDIARRLLGFSLPLVVSSLAAFYIVFGDRFFLRRSWGLAAVGLYGLAYRFGFAFYSLSYEPFRRAWDVQKYQIYGQPDAQEMYRLVFGLISKVLIVAALCVSLFINDFLRIFVGKEYWSASTLVPLLMATFVVRPLTDFCNLGLLLKEQTRHLAHASWLAAVAMTVGYLTLIPWLGAMGAAITAFVGVSTEVFWINHTATRCYDMRLDWPRFFLTGAIAVAAFLCAMPFMGDTMLLMPWKVLILVTALASIFLSPATSTRERQVVIRYSQAILNRSVRLLRRT